MSHGFALVVAACVADGVEVPSAEEYSRIRWSDEDYEKGGAKQEFADQCDINRIVRQFDRDGVITHLREDKPQWLDVTQVPDYRTAMTQVAAAEQYFMQLPAKVREKFRNDPAELMDCLADPSKRSMLEELELVPKLEEEPPPPAADSPPPNGA